MPTEYQGELDARDKKFAIVAARWHQRFSSTLLSGAIETLVQHGADEENIEVYRCPGSFEIPQVASRVAGERDVDAIVCLGVLVRGETPHFDYIASEATAGIGRAGTDGDVPVTYGVLTCDTMEQAMARSGSKQGNKEAEAAEAAVEMASLYEQIEGT
ncbi:MAG: 6,7-dimethyl-8-ribityllumazine synthase [Bradymonadaceae bacterium]